MVINLVDLIKFLLILAVSALSGYVSAAYFLNLPKEQPIILNKTEKVIISEEKGIVEVIKKVQPWINEAGLVVTNDGWVATLGGLKQIDKTNLLSAELAKWDELQLGQRVIIVGKDKVDAGIISQIKKDSVLTNIESYIDVNGLPVADINAKVIGLAKVIQGRVNIMPIKLDFIK